MLDAAEQDYRGVFDSVDHFIHRQLGEHLPRTCNGSPPAATPPSCAPATSARRGLVRLWLRPRAVQRGQVAGARRLLRRGRSAAHFYLVTELPRGVLGTATATATATEFLAALPAACPAPRDVLGAGLARAAPAMPSPRVLLATLALAATVSPLGARLRGGAVAENRLHRGRMLPPSEREVRMRPEKCGISSA